MLGIGWVMFWKAAAVSIAVALGEAWRRYRKRRSEQGLPLKPNRKTGIYQVSDWTERVERYARRAWSGLLVLVVVWWIVLAILFALVRR